MSWSDGSLESPDEGDPVPWEAEEGPLAVLGELLVGVLAETTAATGAAIGVPTTDGNVTCLVGERDAAPPGEGLAAVRAAFRGEGVRGVFEADFRPGAGDKE